MSAVPVTTNVDTAMRMQLEYYGTGRYELAAQAVTPDYVDHKALPVTPAGPEGANAVLRWLRGAFNDLSYEVQDAFGEGDRVAARVNGKVAEHWAKRDDVALAGQLGLFDH